MVEPTKGGMVGGITIGLVLNETIFDGGLMYVPSVAVKAKK